VLEFALRASGFVAVMPPAGFSYLKLMPEPARAVVSGDFGTEVLFTTPAPLLFEVPALPFWRSSLLSSAVAFGPFFDAFGTTTDDLCRGVVADFGVSGLIADWRGSRAGFAEDERA